MHHENVAVRRHREAQGTDPVLDKGFYRPFSCIASGRVRYNRMIGNPNVHWSVWIAVMVNPSDRIGRSLGQAWPVKTVRQSNEFVIYLSRNYERATPIVRRQKRIEKAGLAKSD